MSCPFVDDITLGLYSSINHYAVITYTCSCYEKVIGIQKEINMTSITIDKNGAIELTS